MSLWFAWPGSAADELAPRDRTFLVDYLLRSQRMYRDEVSGLSPEQWRFKPQPNRWSVAECAEHIILAELPPAVQAQVDAKVVREGKVPSAWFLEQIGAKGIRNGDIHVAEAGH